MSNIIFDTEKFQNINAIIARLSQEHFEPLQIYGADLNKGVQTGKIDFEKIIVPPQFLGYKEYIFMFETIF